MKRKKKRIISALLMVVFCTAMICQTLMAASGNADTISVGLDVGGVCRYGSYSTHYYHDETNNNAFAYCVQPSKNSPSNGTYVANMTDIPGIKALLYYGYGGPGFNDETNGMANLITADDLVSDRLPYSYTHIALAIAYGDTGALSGMSGSVLEAMNGFYEYYRNLDSTVPGGFTAYLFRTGSATQIMATWRYIPKGNLNLKKISVNPGLTDGNSCYSLKGAEFGVYKDLECTNQVATLITDESGNSNTVELDEGLHYVKETVAPKGFSLSDEVKAINVLSGQTTTVSFADLPQADPVGVLLGKKDKETSQSKPQGSASLAGAEFTVKFYEGIYDTDPAEQGKTSVRAWVIRTNKNGIALLSETYKISGDEFYYINGNPNPVFPLGTITIEETKAPSGYLINGEVYVRQITSSGSAEMVSTYNQPTIPEQIIRGGVKIAKMDSEKNEIEAQGSAVLAGTQIDIVSLNENTVIVDGIEYSDGQVVKTIVTDENGVAVTNTDTLPCGDYKAVENVPPNGYLPEGILEREFSIRENGVIVDLTDTSNAIKDDVIRGGVKIQKRDLETGDAESQGSATLEGVRFNIVSLNENTVIVDGVEYNNGQVVKTIVTDENGVAVTSTDAFPHGHYRADEKSPSNGYLTDGAVSIEFDITEDGKIVNLTSKENSIYNQVKRGDVEGVKISAGTHERLANVPFKITSVTTGESHVVVTDVNGQFSTSAEWVSHKQNTNAGTSSEDGVWFGTSEPDDSKGALLHDTYELEELRCESNKDMNLIPPFQIVVSRNNHVVNLGTLTDSYAKKITIVTTAAEKETGEKSIVEGKNVTITDTVILDGLSVGTKYQLKGWQMVKEENTELLIDEKRVENDLTFIATDSRMVIQVDYTFNARKLGGKNLVTFEELYDLSDRENPIKVADHKEIEDEGQTVFMEDRVIDIHTTAVEKETGKKSVVEGENVTIVDTVTLDGLEVGAEYQLKGWEMLKEKNAELLVDGKRVENEVTFTATDSHMEIPVEFTFNGKWLGGKQLVSYEELYDITNPENPVKVVEHKDIENEGQTVSIEERKIDIHTAAVEKETGKKSVVEGKNVTIVDTVTLDGLEVGAEYQLKGWEMLKEKNVELLVDGKRVENEVTFTATDFHMEIPVEFTFNGKWLGGKQLVSYEELYDITSPENPVKVAEHKDIEDEGQTVSIEERKINIYTVATDKALGEKLIFANEEVTIVDTVTMEGLEVGTEYQLKGWEMLKEENAELLIDGKRVEKELVFTATDSKMELQIEFTFNASKLGGKELVTFEKLYDITNPENPVEVAEHKEITDEGQTVTIQKQPRPIEQPKQPKKPKTGDETPIGTLVGVVVFAGAVLVAGICYKKKKGGKNRTLGLSSKSRRCTYKR